jgi:mono/diheme cytochrome c family protein
MKTGIAVLLLTGAALPGAAFADAAAGKAKFDAVCSECHETSDFAGKSAAELTTTLKGIQAGTIKHKGKVKLTDAEIADFVQHFAPGASPAKAAAAANAEAGTKPGSGSPTAASAGKALFEKQCAECHEPAEFAGKSAADLDRKLAGIAAGKIKHKGKMKLAAAERRQVADWLASAR